MSNDPDGRQALVDWLQTATYPQIIERIEVSECGLHAASNAANHDELRLRIQKAGVSLGLARRAIVETFEALGPTSSISVSGPLSEALEDVTIARSQLIGSKVSVGRKGGEE